MWKVKYLEFRTCPKCGKKGSLFGMFRKDKGYRTWQFSGFYILHQSRKYSSKKYLERKLIGKRSSSGSVCIKNQKCCLGRSVYKRFKIGLIKEGKKV